MALFEREIRFIYDFNLNKVKKIGSFLTFEQLKEVDLHPAVLQYISAEIDFLIFEDRQKLLKESVFDYSGKSIALLFNKIDDEIKKSKKFSLEYINKILLHSTSFTINYLVRPRWTLGQFLFDNAEEKSSAEIKQILNYVYYYSYIKETIVSYLDKKKIVSVKRKDMEELLAKVDKLGVETYLHTIFETSIKSITEFFNIGSVQNNKISLQAIEMFLEEKSLQQHVQKLQNSFPGDPRPKADADDIRNLLLETEYTDLSIDPYMPEETIEEDRIQSKQEPEFEELEEMTPMEEEEIQAEDVEEDFDPDKFIQESLNEPSKQEESEDAVQTDEFDQKMTSIINEFNAADSPSPEPDKNADSNFEANELETLLNEQNEEIDTEIEKIGNNTAEETETNITVNYPEEPVEEIFEEDTTNDDVVDRAEEILEVESNEEELVIDNSPAEVEENLDDNELGEELLIDEEISTEDEGVAGLQNEEVVLEDSHEDDDTIESLLGNESEEKVVDEDREKNENETASNSIIDSIFEEVDENEELEIESEGGIETEAEESTIDESSEEIAEKNSESGTTLPVEEDVKEFSSDINDENSFNEIEEEPELFPNVEPEKSDNEIEEEVIETVTSSTTSSARIDISELLENKNMTKIIKVIFDYDMEDFANTIEQISECYTKDEADKLLEDLYSTNRVKTTSKEAQAFNEIISEYFGSEG